MRKKVYQSSLKNKFLVTLSAFVMSTLLFTGCGDTNTATTTPEGEVSTETSEYSDINEIDKLDLPVEEKYELGLALIDMEEYLTAEYDNVIAITPKTALEMKENGDTFVVINGRSDCRYCKYVYPGASEVAPEGMTLYYVSTDYFRFLYPEDENSELFQYVKAQHDAYKEAFDFTGVPNIRYIKNNSIEIAVSNPLSDVFFNDDATNEDKENCLDNMKSTLVYYLTAMYEDMGATSSDSGLGNGVGATVNRSGSSSNSGSGTSNGEGTSTGSSATEGTSTSVGSGTSNGEGTSTGTSTN